MAVRENDQVCRSLLSLWRHDATGIKAVVKTALSLVLAAAPVAGPLVDARAEAGSASSFSSSSLLLDPAHQLAGEVIAALGGMAKVRLAYDVASLAKGRMTDFSAMSGAANTVQIELLSKRDKFRIELEVLGQKAVTGYDGKLAWQQHGDEVFPSDPVTSRKIAEDTSHGALLLLKLEDPDVAMKTVPDKVVQGKSCAGLEVTVEGKTTTLYIDRDSHMILATEYVGMDFEQGTDALKRNEFSDYRPFCGSLIAFKSVEYTDEKKTSEQLLTAIEVKEDLSESVFDMPQRKSIAGLSKGPVVIPFEFLSNEVVVKARVNDRAELRFLLDTGATQNVMEKTTATTFGTVSKSGMSLTTGSGFVTMGGIVLQSLQLGEIKLTDVPLAVADMPGFAQIKGGRPAGILGANILRRFAVTVDYEQKKVYFRDPSSLIVPEGAAVVQAQPALGSSGLSVDGLIDGKTKLRFLVDTGAGFNSVTEPLLKPVLNFPLLPVGSVEGVDGYKVEVGAVQLQSLGLDQISIANPVFSVAPGESLAKMPAGLLSASALGILGNTYWKHFRLTVDYLNGRIILEQSANSKLSQSILAESRKIFVQYLKERQGDVAVSAFDELLAKLESPDLIKTRAQVALDKANVVAENLLSSQAERLPGASGQASKPGSSQSAGSSQAVGSSLAAGVSPAQAATAQATGVSTGQASLSASVVRNASRAFASPYLLAKECNDPSLQARVLSDQCLFLLDHEPTGTDLQSARQLLQMASSLTESEPDLLVAAAVYFTKSGSPQATRKMIDQALVQDPSNWRALLERYHIAKKELKTQEEHRVLEVIDHYYPGCNLAYAK